MVASQFLLEYDSLDAAEGYEATLSRILVDLVEVLKLLWHNCSGEPVLMGVKATILAYLCAMYRTTMGQSFEICR